MGNTLVLDTSYRAIARVPWQRAITLLFMGKVEVIEEYEHDVRSVTFTLRMPAVVRFLRGVRGKNKVIKFSRDNVYVRDNGTCQYCLRKVSRAQATYDHVLPRARGGKTEWTNIVIACVSCNQAKRDHTPEEARMPLRSKPVRPKKLPDAQSFTLTWKPGDPDSWKMWLQNAVRSAHYWHSELEE